MRRGVVLANLLKVKANNFVEKLSNITLNKTLDDTVKINGLLIVPLLQMISKTDVNEFQLLTAGRYID